MKDTTKPEQPVEPDLDQIESGEKREVGSKEALLKLRTLGEDTIMRHEEEDSYISQFYLGQQIEKVLEGDLRRPPPNFQFQSCHNRRLSTTKLQPFTLKR